MEIIINQISNAGLSLTKDTNKKLIEMYNVLEKSSKTMKYQEFQSIMIENNIFSGSYIRSVIPFIYSLGIINDYNHEIEFKTFFTRLGISYIKILQTIADIDENSDIMSNLISIKQDIIVSMLKYMKDTNAKYVNEYMEVLKYVLKNKKINRDEFFLMEYCIENKIDNFNFINTYRNDKDYYTMKIRKNDGEISDYTSNNAFNYVIALLVQADLLCKFDGNYYVINQARIGMINDFIKEE